jgi:N-acetylmuramoyl-L-alanine amidase
VKRRTALAALALAALLVPGAPGRARSARVELPVSPVAQSVPVRHIQGQPYLSALDLARLLGASRVWRADVRRLTLVAAGHHLEVTAEIPFARVDSSVVRLPFPPLRVAGELFVPASLADTLPRDPSLPRLLYDGARDEVVVLPPGGVVRAAGFSPGDSATTLVFAADHPEEAMLADRTRDHFRLRFSGYFAGLLPELPARGGLLRSLRPIGTASGCAFELVLDPATAAFRLERDGRARTVTLTLRRAALPGFESFTPASRALPPGTPVVVLDAGHGGADEGVSAGGLTEKQLTLELARLLRDELERRGIARVVLTRDDDRALTPRQRAEAGNHAGADLFLSLHFDGFPVARSRGATAWCPPLPPGGAVAGATGRAREREERFAPITLTPWRDVARRHAVRSRALAEAVRSALVLHDRGPVRVRETLPGPLVGVDAPGLMLDCATLTSPGDLDRLRAPDGLRTLAATLADAIAAWRRNS